MSEHEDTTREWGKWGRTSEEPDVEAHWSTNSGRADEATEPDAQSPEQKAEHKNGADEPDVEAHSSKFCG